MWTTVNEKEDTVVGDTPAEMDTRCVTAPWRVFLIAKCQLAPLLHFLVGYCMRPGYDNRMCYHEVDNTTVGDTAGNSTTR